MKDGFVKVAAASPVIRVADADYNAGRVIDCIKSAADKGVKIIVFPELTLTGCSCYDLIGHSVILRGAENALVKVNRGHPRSGHFSNSRFALRTPWRLPLQRCRSYLQR